MKLILFNVSLCTDLNSSTPPDSAHIYQVIGGGRSSSGSDAASPSSTNQEEEPRARSEALFDGNSMYARVSKKEGPTMPPAPPARSPEEVKEVKEEASPTLPDRRTQLEG